MDQSPGPRPSLLLVGASFVVFAACVVMTSAAIAMMIRVAWDPCSWIVGAFFLPLFVFLAVQQYRGTFCRNAKAARLSSVLLFCVGVMASFAFAAALLQIVASGFSIPWMSLLVPMLTVGIVGCAGAWLNHSWFRRLQQLKIVDELSTGRMRFSLRQFLAAVTAISCCVALATRFVPSIPPRYAENVSLAEAPFGLPAGAASISFCQGFRGTIAYEFTVDEEQFVTWVEARIGSSGSNSAGAMLQEISTPYTIRRYCSLTTDLTGPGSAVVANGLYYAWSKADRGVYAAFDRAAGRAYYYAHFH